MRDELVELGVAPPKQFAVVRLGIELAERVGSANGRVEQRRLLGISPDRFVVGWIGRMTEVKRTDHVLLAFRQLRESGVDASLCLVGDGPDRPAIERRAKELGIMRETLFLGFQQDVAPFYAAFDVLLLPSVSEGTPVSAIEALAAGRPVVATRVGGVPDVVRDGEDGLLAEPGAIGELSDGLALPGPAIPSCGSGWVPRAESASSNATRSRGSSTRWTCSTARCCASSSSSRTSPPRGDRRAERPLVELEPRRRAFAQARVAERAQGGLGQARSVRREQAVLAVHAAPGSRLAVRCARPRSSQR